MYDHQRTVILPKVHYEWIHLRLQDFKIISEYNSVMFKITSQLKLCGEKTTDNDMLEKIFSTFHASNILPQQQYREKYFKRYSELISCLLVTEQNNEILLKNHEARPIGSTPFPEVNASIYDNSGQGRGVNVVVVVAVDVVAVMAEGEFIIKIIKNITFIMMKILLAT